MQKNARRFRGVSLMQQPFITITKAELINKFRQAGIKYKHHNEIAERIKGKVMYLLPQVVDEEIMKFKNDNKTLGEYLHEKEEKDRT